MLSEKENAVYKYVKSRLSQGISPSVREIAEACGFGSTSTAHRCISSLCEKGVIEKTDNLNRTLRLPNSHIHSVPVLGTVAAGQPILAVQECDIQDYVKYDGGGYDDDELFALKIRGESMINAGILDGDIVIVERTPYAENGDIVVALIDDEATVKTFYKENRHYRLQPENDTMQPIIVDELKILGKVIALRRYY